MSISYRYWVPSDIYELVVFAFVVESATNKSIPITTLAIGDSGLIDFTTISVDELTWTNFTNVTQDGPTAVQVKSRTIYGQIWHSGRAVLLTVWMFYINWVLALCSIIIAFIAFRRRGEMKDGVAILPITFIFSIPTLRSFYAGSPPFGIFLGAYQHRPAPLPGIDVTF